jgi:uncharacterized protein (TIGR02996 family)
MPNVFDDPEAIAFIRAIKVNPDDDLPRLVFADYLDERGLGERAEFIRVQCRIAEHERRPIPAGVRKLAETVSGFFSATQVYAAAEPEQVTRDRYRERALLVAFPAAPYWQVPAGLTDSHPHRDITATPDAIIRCFGRGVRDVRLTYARGFVARVECEAAVWWGGAPCWACDNIVPRYPDGCPTCNRTGYAAGVGREIVAAHPVTEVVITDREPLFMTGGTATPGDTYRWLRCDGSETAAMIPGEVLDHIANGDGLPSYYWGRLFHTAEDARAALSAAALAWASAPPPNPKADFAPRWGPG